MISVTCFLWQDEHRQRSYTFDERHVITLRNMVARHLRLDHEFVCVTDREHIADGIRCVPIDDRTHVPGTCGRKLTIWAPDAAERIGKRILSLDLDMVIVDDITPLIDRPEPTVMFKNPNFSVERRRAFYQGSIQLTTAGAHPEVWELFFHPHRKTLIDEPGTWPPRARFGGFEQAWLSEILPWDLPALTDEDGIYGAGRIGDWSNKTIVGDLPENAKIVVFPGNRNVDQPDVTQKFPFILEHYA
jgi:hypothetical protein